MKCLITGGAGFIGSHLAEVLLKQKCHVNIIDDLSTGSIENVSHLKNDPCFSYVIDTIFNKQLMTELIDDVDIIFHLAAAVGVRLIVESPVKTIETNIKGTEMVLELASKKKKKVLIASTSEVYGKSTCNKFSEIDDLVLGPTTKTRWSYAASKIVDEFLALSYWKERNVPVIIVRLFNTVGPRQTGQYGMVVPRFVSQGLSNEPITVYGNGKQTRTFTHVKDVIFAILELAKHPKTIGEIFNIGGNEETSIENLAIMVKQILNSQSEIIYIPYEHAYEKGFDDMMKRAPDLKKVQKFIDFSPQLGLKDIILDVAAYMRSKGKSNK